MINYETYSKLGLDKSGVWAFASLSIKRKRIMKINLFYTVFFIVVITLLGNCTKPAIQNPSSKEEITSKGKKEFLLKGKEIATATFVALSSQLKKSLQKGGVSNAIQYCNLSAYPITDSLGEVHNALIRRTSLKVRNQNNRPTANEQVVINEYLHLIETRQNPKPKVVELDSHNVVFYAPIYANQLCLKCHGILGKTLDSSDLSLIKNYYPRDSATGYIAGDLRGIWSIRFDRN